MPKLREFPRVEGPATVLKSVRDSQIPVRDGFLLQRSKDLWLNVGGSKDSVLGFLDSSQKFVRDSHPVADPSPRVSWSCCSDVESVGEACLTGLVGMSPSVS